MATTNTALETRIIKTILHIYRETTPKQRRLALKGLADATEILSADLRKFGHERNIYTSPRIVDDLRRRLFYNWLFTPLSGGGCTRPVVPA